MSKYGRTYHFTFSPGTTSDDRFNYDYANDIKKMKRIVITEKLDGENNAMMSSGVFARSHAAPTTSNWTKQIRQEWEMMKDDFGDLEFFGENLYAIHSIIYPNIDTHYYVFGVRQDDVWLSWDKVVEYAELFGFKTVPVIAILDVTEDLVEHTLQELISEIVKKPSVFGSLDVHTGEPCTMEGVVVRNYDSYTVKNFKHNVFKWVRKGHVKTDEHWTKNWKRAPLIFEKY